MAKLEGRPPPQNTRRVSFLQPPTPQPRPSSQHTDSSHSGHPTSTPRDHHHRLTNPSASKSKTTTPHQRPLSHHPSKKYPNLPKTTEDVSTHLRQSLPHQRLLNPYLFNHLIHHPSLTQPHLTSAHHHPLGTLPPNRPHSFSVGSIPLQTLPNSHQISYHHPSASVHSHHLRPVDAGPTEPPLSRSATAPRPAPARPPSGSPTSPRLGRRPPSPPVHPGGPRRSISDQSGRVVTGVLRASMPAQRRPELPGTTSEAKRPQSMSAGELAARHKAALHKLQQPITKPAQPIQHTSPSRPSPLSKGVRNEDGAGRGRRASALGLVSTPHPRQARQDCSAYVKQLRDTESGQRLVEKRELSDAQRALLQTLPPLPPSRPLSGAKPAKKPSVVGRQKKEDGDDPFSWLDY